MTLRFCMPELSTNGLGNQAYSWAKAFIASQELGARCLHPAWSRNARQYRRLWRTSGVDWPAYRLLTRALPVEVFSAEDFRRIGEPDYRAAVRRFAAEKGLDRRRAYVLITPGMWGGHLAIASARAFLLSQIYRAHGVAESYHRIDGRLDREKLRVCFHYRAGDFEPETGGQDRRGLWITSLPVAWYAAIARVLRSAFGERVEFILVTDARGHSYDQIVAAVKPTIPPDSHSNEPVDLLLLANADLLVCSPSSFSMLGAYLSEQPYLWHEGQLLVRDGRWSLGHDAYEWGMYGDLRERSAALTSPATGGLPRGVPVREDGSLPPELLRYLESRLATKQASRDLLLFGTLPGTGQG